ncbi:conserved hypothetical protein [Verticillium alfalfae VaMs.102]|uniref:U4/U6.U5 tri-snRNP-associated protein snu66 n=1 Tax=Verticillium alfalfae (strain VaMs.102 / ATCC MYA-4576 / FGSC 10136) TaxID=526221 RepID=C9SAP2_VERA1|nr:conserved hypothetical protein [Verticillium alfalfae VaMs.102]EEY15490.1 conserved hypothetical protein [Verticillium alfalfae VaMs.102]
MDAATIEETNRMRESLGLKPLPVPGAAPPSPKERRAGSESDEEEEEEASTIDTRQAQSYDNYRQIREAEEAKRKREARVAAAKKERDNAQRLATLEGKGLGEEDDAGDLDAKAWLKAQKKRQKTIAKTRKFEEEQAAAEAAAAAALEYTSKDLAGVKVAHELDSFLDGDDQILTLKDTTIDQNEEEGDELENLDLRAQEKLKENLDLKKKRPAYDVHNLDDSEERGLLSQYDEEIYGKKSKKFTLDSSGAIAELADILDGPSKKKKDVQNIDLDAMEDAPKSDYLDISEIKVRKPKKKKSKSTRQKPVDEDDIIPEVPAPVEDEQMDIDSEAPVLPRKRKVVDDSFVDDEDLQASLAIQRRTALKKRKRTRPEDIARELKEQTGQPEEEDQGGVIIDEISEFVSGLKKPDEDEDRKARRSKQVTEQSITAMHDESDDDGDLHMGDASHVDASDAKIEDPIDYAGIDEERTIGAGMGSALTLLRERGLVQDAHGAELNEEFRRKSEFLAARRRLESEQDERTRDQREKDRKSGRWDRMSIRDREEYARQQNTTPTSLAGRLDQKEAFKHLSHQFHGKGSGKGKTDKRLKKIEAEKKRESQSILDASENATMSSSSSKRKEAGVRLQ